MQKWLPKNGNFWIYIRSLACSQYSTQQKSTQFWMKTCPCWWRIKLHAFYIRQTRTCLDSTFEPGKILAVLGTTRVTPCAKCSFFSATNIIVLFELRKDMLETALPILNCNLLQTSITLRKMKLESREVSLNFRKLRTPEKYPWTTPSNNVL